MCINLRDSGGQAGWDDVVGGGIGSNCHRIDCHVTVRPKWLPIVCHGSRPDSYNSYVIHRSPALQPQAVTATASGCIFKLLVRVQAADYNNKL